MKALNSMQDFRYSNNALHAEGCNLNDLANHYGSPLYVYSRAAFERSYMEYANALGDHPGKICYAVKANSNIAVLQLLAKLGAGFDIVSSGELRRALKAGGKPENIIFSGVGKTRAEMLEALEANIACFNVESEAELDTLSDVASTNNKIANVSLRVNPDVNANTHPYISTGLKENKFGIDIQRAPDAYQRAASLPGLNVIGVDCHIGSQIIEVSPFLDALSRVLKLVDLLAERSISIKHLDLGGGVGVRYKDETPPSITDYIGKIKSQIAGRGLDLFFEPGRSIAANSGILLTEVLYLKPTEHKNFAVVDAAMNDNIRPSLYSAWQEVKPVDQKDSGTLTWDIVGPVCETGDFLAKDRHLNLAQGDHLALMSSGAYGFVMSSNYNSRGRAAEVLVDGDKHFLIRRRETFDDIINGEELLDL